MHDDGDFRSRVLDAIDDAQDFHTFTHRGLHAALALAEMTALAHEPITDPRGETWCTHCVQVLPHLSDWPCEWILAAARIVGIKPKERTP